MPDIISRRETVIVITDEYGPLPADTLFPNDVLFPGSRYVTNIVAGTLKLDELLAESFPVFGEMYATKFEVQVYNEEDLSGKYIHVYQQNEGVYSDIFSGYIDSCKVDKIGTDRTIVAYDVSYLLRQTDVTTWWNYYWNTTIPSNQVEGSGNNARKYSTLGHARNAMLTYLGIEHETPTLINDNMRIYKDISFSECSLQQMLSMMCELSCCFPHFDRNGILKFKVLDPTAIPVDISDAYEWMNSDFEDYTTSPITGVQFYDSEDNAKYSVGTEGNAYPIKKNIFTYSLGTAALTSIANNMIPYLQALIYTPAKVKMIIGSFDYELGDYVHTSLGNFFILQNSYSGSQFMEEQLVCKGSEENYSQFHNVNREDLILNEKFSRLNYSVEGLETEFGEIHEGLVDYTGTTYPTIQNNWNTTEKDQRVGVTYRNTSNDTYYKFVKNGNTYSWQQISKSDIGVSVIRSRITQTANQINLKVSKGNISSELSLETGQIRLQTGRLIIESGNFKIDSAGNVTASNANLQNATLNGQFNCGSDLTGYSKLHLTGGDIDFYYSGSLIGKICARRTTYTYGEILIDEELLIEDPGNSSGGNTHSSGDAQLLGDDELLEEELIEEEPEEELLLEESYDVDETMVRLGSEGSIILAADDTGTSSSLSSGCYIILNSSSNSSDTSNAVAIKGNKLSVVTSDNASFSIGNTFVVNSGGALSLQGDSMRLDAENDIAIVAKNDIEVKATNIYVSRRGASYHQCVQSFAGYPSYIRVINGLVVDISGSNDEPPIISG